jgi:hypothetical protein
MKSTTVFLASLVLLLGLASGAEATRPRVYSPPQSLNLEIKTKPNADPKAYAVLTATLKSLVGNLTQMKVHFESSEDLEVSPKTAPIESLAHGTMKTFDLSVIKTGSTPGVSGSWVRVRVEFLPDYEAIMEIVARDQKTYPLEGQRNQLLKSLEDVKSKAVKSIQAKGYLFPSQNRTK